MTDLANSRILDQSCEYNHLLDLLVFGQLPGGFQHIQHLTACEFEDCEVSTQA
jgi:hypothetical protein